MKVLNASPTAGVNPMASTLTAPAVRNVSGVRDRLGLEVDVRPDRPRVKQFLTQGERTFYQHLSTGVLELGRSLGRKLQAWPQVSMKAVIPLPQDGSTLHEHLTKLEVGLLATGVFDFVVTCGPAFYPLLAVECDLDPRHRNNERTIVLDERKNKICKVCRFPLLRFPFDTPDMSRVEKELVAALEHAPVTRHAVLRYLETELPDHLEFDDPDLLEPGDIRSEAEMGRWEVLRRWLEGLVRLGPEVIQRAALALTGLVELASPDLSAVFAVERSVMGLASGPVRADWRVFSLHPSVRAAVKAADLATERPGIAARVLEEAAYEASVSARQAYSKIRYALLPWARGEVDPLEQLYQDLTINTPEGTGQPKGGGATQS